MSRVSELGGSGGYFWAVRTAGVLPSELVAESSGVYSWVGVHGCFHLPPRCAGVPLQQAGERQQREAHPPVGSGGHTGAEAEGAQGQVGELQHLPCWHPPCAVLLRCSSPHLGAVRKVAFHRCVSSAHSRAAALHPYLPSIPSLLTLPAWSFLLDFC